MSTQSLAVVAGEGGGLQCNTNNLLHINVSDSQDSTMTP